MKARGVVLPPKQQRTLKARDKTRRLPLKRLSNEDLMSFAKAGWRVRSSAMRTLA